MHQPRQFLPTDFNEMESWYKKRNLDCIPITYLPEIGFIIPDVCAGFLYQTDGKFGLIENFITNPDADKKDRNMGLDLLLNKLIESAKNLDYDYVIATTNDDTILKRGEKIGAKSVGLFDLIYKKL